MTLHRNVAARVAAGLLFALLASSTFAAAQVRIESGVVEGTSSADGAVQIFKGIPYAAPPVGELRWKEPQPPANWEGVRQAKEFGARCVQGPIYSGMKFRDAGASEDCLHLNVWTPNASQKAKLPVMVWIYGGGFQAGASSEARQDAENLARRGVVIVSMDYRLGVFGFFSHPELTKESPHHASGNYGLLDQVAALRWVRRNIAAFGGDPGNVTIFGESAGSFSVSALMASPVSKALMHRAIGESGAFFGGTLSPKPLSETESVGGKFAAALGAGTLEQLRAMPAEQLLDAVVSGGDPFLFGPNLDGYFLSERPAEIYRKGEQAHIELLAGWNHDEGDSAAFFGTDAATKENYLKKLDAVSRGHAAEMLKYFPGGTDEQVKESAGLLATASFIGFGTWKWIEMQTQLHDPAVYRYEFDQPRPLRASGATAGATRLAIHAAEIEYVFGLLKLTDLPWQKADFDLSEEIGDYWTNFAKRGDPNGKGLIHWPRYDASDDYQVIHLASKTQAAKDQQREQYLFLDRLSARPQ